LSIICDIRSGFTLGVPLAKREEFLARFSKEQLEEYFTRYCDYARLAQGPILENPNGATWLARVVRRFPGVKAVEYVDERIMPIEGRELEPMSVFSPWRSRSWPSLLCCGDTGQYTFGN
jgi:hypothetical protein